MQYNDALVDYAPRNNEGTLPDYSTSGGGYYSPVLIDYAPRGDYGQLPDSGFYNDVPIKSASTDIPTAQSEPTFHDDPKADGLPKASDLLKDLGDFNARDYLVNCPDGTTDIANGIVAPCMGRGLKKPVTPVTPVAAAPVSKNLKPYIYAGIAIVAILIAAKVLSKK